MASISDERTHIDAGRNNALNVPESRARDGVAVIIGRDELQVADDFYRLGEVQGVQWLPETPPSLEYNMVTRGRGGSVRWNIRFPMAAGHDTEACVVWDAVHSALPSTRSTLSEPTLRALRTAGIRAVLISQVALVLGLVLYLQRGMQGVTLACCIIGAITFPAGIVVAATTHFMLQHTLPARAGT